MMQGASLTQRIVIHGKMVLQSPLLIGSGGETDDRKHEVDTYVLKNRQEEPYIPGTSLAGVLRAWMRSWSPEDAELLFGRVNRGTNGKDDLQSAIDIADILLTGSSIITRDGVGIDDITGTGKDGVKYDYEAVERGAAGDLSIVLTIRQFHEWQNPDLRAVVTRLADQLCTGVRIGALTTKGFGKAVCENVRVEFYDFHQPEAVQAWMFGKPAPDIYQAKPDRQLVDETFVVDADFALRSSLLVRSSEVSAEEKEDKIQAVPMRSQQDYLIPGTTLKGVLRHQAGDIMRAIGKSPDLLDSLMGYSNNKSKSKSRFLVDEVYFRRNVREEKQTRNRIDRFTGGTIEGALFTNKALWQKEAGKASLHIHFEIQSCKDWEAGLALFLLRDLWTGRIAIGGEKSIGRGTLQGITGQIHFQKQDYELSGNGKVLSGNSQKLEKYAKALHEYSKEVREA